MLCKKSDIVTVIKIGKLRWLGHLFRMQEFNSCTKFILTKSEGTRHVGKPRLRWLNLVEKDLKDMGVRNWRYKLKDQEQWRNILEEFKVHQALQCQKKKKKKKKKKSPQETDIYLACQ
jgi:hypothetical protein